MFEVQSPTAVNAVFFFLYFFFLICLKCIIPTSEIQIIKSIYHGSMDEAPATPSAALFMHTLCTYSVTTHAKGHSIHPRPLLLLANKRWKLLCHMRAALSEIYGLPRYRRVRVDYWRSCSRLLQRWVMSLAAIVAFGNLSTPNNYVYIYDGGPGFNGSIRSHSNSHSAHGFPVIFMRDSASEEASLLLSATPPDD